MPNILVIDDSGLIRLKVRNILEEEGFNIFEADGLRPVQANSFSNNVGLNDIDLILLDIYLKDGNGLELLEFLSHRYPNIPVIMMSVEGKKEIIIKAINLGAKAYIIKPFDKSTLLSKINSLLPIEKLEERYRSNVASLLTNVSLEINRSVRSKLPFSLLKIELSEPESEVSLNNLKEIITTNVREIDQVYLVDKHRFILLLPLTSKSGTKVLLERIQSKIKGICKKFKSDIISFPEDIDDAEKINFRNQKEYKKIIFQKLGISSTFSKKI